MLETPISPRTQALLRSTVVWDNHGCLPLRADTTFLPQLERYRNAGVNVVSINVGMARMSWVEHVQILSFMRQWIALHPDTYCLLSTVEDVRRCKVEGKLGVVFDIEGMYTVQNNLSLVQTFYELGVRWMLIAYNHSNAAGSGCQDDEDSGLTDVGRAIIDEMERVGMVLCCSHTGYRTALEAIEYSKNPVIFSHSNPRALEDHERNIPDGLMRACARKGGVVNLNGMGIFLGNNDNSTETLLRHIDHAVELIGAEHVGLGLDYVFDQAEFDEHIRTRPDIFPPEKGYQEGIAMIEPERFPAIAEALLQRGYSEEHVQGILGHNSLRIAKKVWK